MKRLSIPLLFVIIIMIIVIFYPKPNQMEDEVNDCKMLREMMVIGKVINIKHRGKGAFSKITIEGTHNLKQSFSFVKFEDKMIVIDIPPLFARENIDIGTIVSKLQGNYYFFFEKKDKLKMDSVFIYASQQTPNPTYCNELLE